MKSSTKFIFILFLTIIWMIATGITMIDNANKETDVITWFMYSVPFISFFGILIIYNIEFRKENNIK
jgi:hypothetical protein